MHRASHACPCCAIKLINKGEDPHTKRQRRERRNRIKPNYLVRDGSETLYISWWYTWSMSGKLSGSAPEEAAFQRGDVSVFPPGGGLQNES